MEEKVRQKMFVQKEQIKEQMEVDFAELYTTSLRNFEITGVVPIELCEGWSVLIGKMAATENKSLLAKAVLNLHVGTHEACSQNLEPGVSDNASSRGTQQISMSQAQRQMSLFFALCSKKPSLLQLVFDIYGCAPKIIKQVVHRHIPILLKNLGPSFAKLLQIISDPSEGNENLLMLVFKTLTEKVAPSPQLISTVKYLYESKLKDAAILIPMLSLLSKHEILSIICV